ncbi:MAG: RHS repeat-associated core domain-containing protein [Bacteroidota bacterium]
MLLKHPLYYHSFGAPLAGRVFKAEEAQYQLVNDDFTDNVTGWVANIPSGYTMVADGGRLKFDAGTPWAGIIKTFTTVPGTKYHISVKVDMGTTQALYLIVRNIGNVNNTVVVATTNGAYEIDFTAVDNTTTFHLEGLNGGSTTTRTFYIDDVLIQEATNKTYRFGFNGKENDDEVEGQQDYGFRIYDKRLGRFKSIDPLMKSYPELSTYQFASNRPIDGIDLDGLEWKDNKGNVISGEKLKNVKVYIFYNSKPSATQPGQEGGFYDQTMKQYLVYEAQYGKGSVVLSDANTEKEFKTDWGNIDGAPEKVVINHHGSNQAIHLDHRNEEYITSTGNGLTNILKNEGTDISQLPQPKANLSGSVLEINSCHSNEKDMFSEKSQSKKTLAKAFADGYGFQYVRGTSGSVNFNSDGSASPQWYKFSFWENVPGKELQKANKVMENAVTPVTN